ncbi:hypothetical protein CC85DRAFT_287776 [Cutaneotrichosporon oleaginosum]|uniref:Tyrosine--tRNA ligase n=1 Tax=Cutaneotrichosporon oleaginosum TaxID=879819 RepID=A0A0J0XGG4_9TREE|nr:uncharacterized protein CC85DRAFT_287776 [Cutaneotrichosporon oleaginosum]KLT40151.1 hypothetical protein CC85DRAFT_287776 [Cutaneotrichosporon oleaginosum]TXT06884.1 hypothetical protein COLE_06215 [Cutaneotrichosporon oleaginosum]
MSDELEFTNQKEDKTINIALDPEAEARFERITRGLAEVTSADIIRKVLADGETPRLYWGTAPTGRPHIAYCVALIKIADFLSAGVHVKVLLADIHAFLDANKSTMDVLQHRVKYYSYLLHAVLTTLGVPTDKLEFVTGSSYQLKPDYTLDVYRFNSMTTVKQAEHAGADVVKASSSPLMCSLMYPGLQCLDEQYLDVHIQFGGVDQRKIFMFAAHYLPKLGYAKRAHLMNAMVPGLSGGKMSASDPKSKIDFLDSPADVKAKIKAAVSEPGVVEGNGILAFVKAVLIPAQIMRDEQARARGEERYIGELSFASPTSPLGTVFTIARPEKFGGDLHFSSYQELEDAYAAEKLHPGDLKSGVTDALIRLLAPIRKVYDSSPDWQEVDRLGYPSKVSEADRIKAEKNAAKAAKKAKGSNRPPTEEERAALRREKEEKKAKELAAKNAAATAAGAAGASGAALSAGANALAPTPTAGPSAAVLNTDMPKLKLLSKGKVRDIYALPDAADADKLLFVATDRISAFDVIMDNGIPHKGATLTQLSMFWFHKLQHIIPHHVLTPSLAGPAPACLQGGTTAWDEFPASLAEYRAQLEGRSMIVRKCEVVKIEAIVRGYITGSAWNEYKKSQTVHGIAMPPGLVESQKLPKAIFTPSTKADLGDHDENIHPDKAKEICGAEVAAEIERVALELYNTAAEYALARGLILADTKFEFGLLDTPNGKQLILIDEALTPDSSRYWSAAAYVEGKPQDSFDKQYLRDWLIQGGLKAKEGVALPDDVVAETKAKYEEARDRVMGLGQFA